ncbi:MAG: hypothetical protein Q4P23_15445 [Micrococcaceae bacterium]|nr:hypothetical protein [Micrococcaceae bacterium]
MNEAVAEQVEVINERTPFRGEARSRRAWFEEMERAELMELPAQRWQQVEWRKAKVSRDWHVQVDTAKYSVPHEHAGQVLDVWIVGEQVTILAGGDIVATHQRAARRNSFVTDASHAPAGYEDTSLLWTRAYFLRQASKVGPYTVQALTQLLDRLKIEAQGYRSCMNILGLGKGNNRSLPRGSLPDPVHPRTCEADQLHGDQAPDQPGAGIPYRSPLGARPTCARSRHTTGGLGAGSPGHPGSTSGWDIPVQSGGLDRHHRYRGWEGG